MTRELLKKEIDNLSEELLDKVYKQISQIKKEYLPQERNIKLESFKLGKELDKVDIRKYAYDQDIN